MQQDPINLTSGEGSPPPTGDGPKPSTSVAVKVLLATLAIVLVAVGLTETVSVSGSPTVGQFDQDPNTSVPANEPPATTAAAAAPNVGDPDAAVPDSTIADAVPGGGAEPGTQDGSNPDSSAPDGTIPGISQFPGTSSSQFIAADAGTTVPVYDTAWQMLVLATPGQADEYFATLADFGFTGTWAGVVHHAPATYADPFNGGGTVARLEASGEVVLTPEYIAHVGEILDAAERHGRKVGLVAAWQNLYLPGGGADAGNPVSDTVRGTIHAGNSYAYGVQLVEAFGDHPAVSMWVFGGDAGSNNTEENKVVWRNMAAGVRDAGSSLDITYHTPTSTFDQLNYAGEEWLDFVSPETGHGQTAAETQSELLAAADAYQIPVWQGEARYFNINFDWVPGEFRNPGVPQVRADAVAARNAGVAGYVYGDAGRWNWCGGFGDASPCDRQNVAASFGAAEEAVINVFAEPVVTNVIEPVVEPVAQQSPPIADGPFTVDLYEGGICIFEDHPLENLCTEPGLSTVQIIPNR